jgi:hypothetical protein
LDDFNVTIILKPKATGANSCGMPKNVKASMKSEDTDISDEVDAEMGELEYDENGKQIFKFHFKLKGKLSELKGWSNTLTSKTSETDRRAALVKNKKAKVTFSYTHRDGGVGASDVNKTAEYDLTLQNCVPFWKGSESSDLRVNVFREESISVSKYSEFVTAHKFMVENDDPFMSYKDRFEIWLDLKSHASLKEKPSDGGDDGGCQDAKLVSLVKDSIVSPNGQDWVGKAVYNSGEIEVKKTAPFRSTIPHEIGHAWGNLSDEYYIESATIDPREFVNCTSNPLTWGQATRASRNPYKGCGTHPENDGTLIDSSPQFYRASESSFMQNTSGTPKFNVPSCAGVLAYMKGHSTSTIHGADITECAGMSVINE